jgi:hypothetical protein
MPNPLLDLDPAGAFDIEIGENQSFGFSISHFEEDGITPLPILGTVTMRIVINGRVLKAIPVTVAGHVITISQTDAQNVLPAGKYTFYINADQDAGSTLSLWSGSITVKPYAK